MNNITRLLFVLLILEAVIFTGCTLNPSSESPWEGEYHDLRYPVIRDFDNLDISEDHLAAYGLDADRLTVRLMRALGEPASNDIDIPAELRESILNGLLAIYVTDNLAPRDSVIELNNIHTFFYPALYEIIVSADINQSYMKAWATGNRLTGNAVIDGLMEAFDLELKQYNSSWNAYVVLRAGRPLNLLPLAARFASVWGVGYAEPNGFCCDGSDLTLELSGMNWVYTFALKWGDCPSGCIDEHHWLFSVDAGGTVTYLGNG